AEFPCLRLQAGDLIRKVRDGPDHGPPPGVPDKPSNSRCGSYAIQCARAVSYPLSRASPRVPATPSGALLVRFVQLPKSRLGIGAAAVGRQLQPSPPLGGIFRHTDARKVDRGEFLHAFRIAGSRGGYKPLHGLAQRERTLARSRGRTARKLAPLLEDFADSHCSF